MCTSQWREAGGPPTALGPRQLKPNLRGQVRMKHLWYDPRKCAEPKAASKGCQDKFPLILSETSAGNSRKCTLRRGRKPILVLKSSWGHKPTASPVLTSEGNEAASPNYLQTVGQRSLITKTRLTGRAYLSDVKRGVYS